MAQRQKKRKKRKKTSLGKRIWRRFKKKMRFTITVFLNLGVYAAIILTGVFVWDACSSHKDIIPQRTVVASSQYNGIDVSKYQGQINWKKVADDKKIQFVYVKATEGASRVDNKYAENIKKARKEGIKVGSYHYFISRKSAEEQFRNFKRYVDKSQQDLIPMVDVELKGNEQIDRETLQKRLAEFMRLVKDEYGVYPIVYSQYRFYNERLAPKFNKYHIFIARYSNNKPVLKGGGKYSIWQYTEKGKINGINGFVDLDRFANGTKLSDIELK